MRKRLWYPRVRSTGDGSRPASAGSGVEQAEQMASTTQRQRRRIVVIALALLLPLAAILGLESRTVSRFDASADELLARAARVRDGASPQYQQAVLSALPAHPSNGVVLRLDELLPEAEAISVPPAPAGEESDVLFALEFKDPSALGLRAVVGRTSLESSDGVLRARVLGDDVLLVTDPVELPRDEIGEIRIRARSTRGGVLRLGWSVEPKEMLDWYSAIDLNLVADARVREYSIDAKNVMRSDVAAGEVIRQLYFRPSDLEGDFVEIDSLRIVSKLSKYRQLPRGVSHETLGGVTRRVIHALAPQVLRYDLRIPDSAPRLDLGLGVLRSDDPVDFEVWIEAEDGRRRLLSERVSSDASWVDSRIDLSAWAGKTVSLDLTVRGSAKNVAFWSHPTISESPPERLNVVILLEDTLRADHLALNGHHRPTSPNRDRVADEGVVFEVALAQATKTRPSVHSLMTSLYPSATGVWHFADALSPSYLTMAEIMNAQGFETAGFTQNGNTGRSTGLHQGYSQFIDGDLLGDTDPRGALGTQLTAWLERQVDRNTFTFVHVLNPHGPYDPPPPYDDWYREGFEDAEVVAGRTDTDPPWVSRPTKEGRERRYDGQIRWNDDVIGEFLQTLDRLGMSENTLLVLLSDHGEYFGEHGYWEHRPPGFLPVVHVPLILHMPGRLPAGRRVPQKVQLLDVMPTVLELAEIDPDAFLLQGESLLDLIDGRRPEYWERRLVVSEEPMSMTKTQSCDCGSFYFGKWHLMSTRFLGSLQEPGHRVFDLDRDWGQSSETTPWREGRSLGRRFPGVLEEFLATNRESWRNWTGGEQTQVPVDPQALEQLRALGYVR